MDSINPQSQDHLSSFHAKFINKTTVVIHEDDKYNENPLIYIKIYPDLLLITDTGTASPRNKTHTLTLRQFLEEIPIPPFSTESQDSKPKPLNPDGKKRYVILCTHAHYDHILGIPSFISEDVTPEVYIIASGNDRSFILEDLPTHSLCKYLHIPTPEYRISHWTRNLEFLSHPDGKNEGSSSLRIRVLHVPGHTPDSLAWYDVDERYLYIGDIFYARKKDSSFFPLPLENTKNLCDVDEIPEEQEAAIIFPTEGNWVDYLSSLDLIISFVEHENSKSKERVRVGCGHVTFAGDAEVMAREVRALFGRILEGRVPVVRTFEKRGEEFCVWDEGGEYFVEAPRRLWEDARGRVGL